MEKKKKKTRRRKKKRIGKMKVNEEDEEQLNGKYNNRSEKK